MFNLAFEEQQSVVSAIITQLSLKVGLKTWGEKGKKYMKSEMRQIHLRDTFEPQFRHEMSANEKAEVIESHMFLKLNRDGTIKGRAVAVETNEEVLLERRKIVHPRLRSRRCCYPV